MYAKYEEEYMDQVGVALDITWIEHADYKDKLNLEITSGNDWDLVFDASWVQLKNLAPEGYYADLSSYFNNPDEYPGLAKAFSEEVMNASVQLGAGSGSMAQREPTKTVFLLRPRWQYRIGCQSRIFADQAWLCHQMEPFWQKDLPIRMQLYIVKSVIFIAKKAERFALRRR